jgi:3-phenylpropionate/cinnamic acid dioxygenase small subunit
MRATEKQTPDAAPGVAEAPVTFADLATERAIGALILRAARLADEQRYLDWMDLFVEDCRYSAITQENHAALGLCLYTDIGKRALHERVAWLMRLWQTPRGKTLHMVGNLEIEAKGDAAAASSSFLITRTGELEHSKLYACGRYNDRLERRDGVWLFKERQVIVDSNMLPSEFTELL